MKTVGRLIEGICPNHLKKGQIRSVFGCRIGRIISVFVQDLKRQIGILALVLGVSLTATSSQSSLERFDESPDESSPSKRGLIYARVSSSDQLDDNDDSGEKHDDTDEGAIDDQVEETRAIAEDYGIELAHEPIKDKAQTGTDFNRDGIQQVFQLAQRKEVGYLLTQSVDRIGRSAAETLYFIHILQSECDVTLVTASGERDMSSIHGLMHTTLLSLMAEVQNEIRTTKAKKSRVRGFLDKKNWHCYSPVVPLGYSNDGSGWLEQDSSEVDAVKDLFEEFVNCETYDETERKINAEHDDVLDGHRVKTLLTNPIYIGKPQLPDDWVIDLPYDNELDEPELQIVEEETFEKVQSIIDRKNSRHSSDGDTYDVVDFVEEFDLFTVIESSQPARLLHDCGEPMVKSGQRTLKDDIKTHLYRCPECDEYRKWPKENEYDQMELVSHLLETGSDLLDYVK